MSKMTNARRAALYKIAAKYGEREFEKAFDAYIRKERYLRLCEVLEDETLGEVIRALGADKREGNRQMAEADAEFERQQPERADA